MAVREIQLVRYDQDMHKTKEMLTIAKANRMYVRTLYLANLL